VRSCSYKVKQDCNLQQAFIKQLIKAPPAVYIQKCLNKSKEEGYLRMVKGSERPSASEEIGEKFQRPGKSIGRADDEKNRAVKMSAKFT